MKRPEFSRSYEDGTLPLGGSDPTEALPGSPGPRLVLGRYRLERRLGAGGFGVVWLGWDEKLEREVAVKAIPHENGSAERVEREARAAARLNHPGIVAVYELAADEHDVYLVSELVRGRTLAELNKAGAVSDRDVARIGVALCEALEHAHANGVIHRDVKPGNVMVVAEPAAGAGFAKLADFGVAHVVSDNPLTLTGDVVGTLAYMAPEQAEGKRAGPASDVYSLALTLYEAWTGTNPIRSGGIAATARRLGQPLPSLADSRPDLPLELCDAIDDALEVQPEHRPRTGELRAELERARKEGPRREEKVEVRVEPSSEEEIGGVNVYVGRASGVDGEALLAESDRIKQERAPAAVVLGSNEDGRVHLVANFDRSLEGRLDAVAVIKEAAAEVGGGGGGRPTMARAGGKNPEKLGDALAKAEEALRRALA